MTITFRVEDSHDTAVLPPVMITASHVAALRHCLDLHGRRAGVEMILPDYGDPADHVFAFEARICPLALATLAPCFDDLLPAIRILDEAQFRGRRIRIWRRDDEAEISLGLSTNPDAAPELEVSSSNGYALLESLGLEPDSVGTIPLDDLRQRLTDPRMRKRMNVEPGLARYVPTLSQMAALQPLHGELHIVWA